QRPFRPDAMELAAALLQAVDGIRDAGGRARDPRAAAILARPLWRAFQQGAARRRVGDARTALRFPLRRADGALYPHGAAAPGVLRSAGNALRWPGAYRAGARTQTVP